MASFTRALFVFSLVHVNLVTCDITNMTSSYCVEDCTSEAGHFWCVDSGCSEFPFDIISPETTFINLSYNSLESVPKLNFTGVVHLDLSYNAIANIADKAFEDCKNLTHLHLSANKLVELSEESMRSNSLEVLDFSMNQINSLDGKVFFWTMMIKSLNFSSNLLSSLEMNTWSGLNELESLDLSRNKLTVLEENDFMGLTKVQYLSVRNNQIELIEPSSLRSLDDTLRILDLGDNRLQEFNSDMFHNAIIHIFMKLQTIHLDSNQIKVIENKTFLPIRSLQYLNLDQNLLTEIHPGAFSTGLREISLQKNIDLLTLGNGTFSGLVNLTTVDISGCHYLTSIQSSAFDGQKSRLKTLKAARCALTTLSQDLLNWSRVTTLQLSGNPWTCDCHLSWMRDKVPTNVTDTVRCSQPFTLKGKTLTEVDSDSLVCTVFSEHRHQIAVGMITFVTSIFVLTSAYLLITYRRRIFRPCITPPQKGDYQTLFNTAQDGEGESAVSIQWENGDSETSALNGATKPTAV